LNNNNNENEVVERQTKMINLKIDGVSVSVPEGTMVLEAARQAKIDIPTLCFLKNVSETGSCRMCVVEIKGARTLQASCVYPVSEGLEVYTNTPTVRKSRKVTMELLLSNHDRKCLTCPRNLNCELQKLAQELNILDLRYKGECKEYEIDDLSPSIVRNQNKCILCKRCVNVCKNIQAVAVIDNQYRGFNSKIGCNFGASLRDISCINCGQCIVSCPTGALSEKDDTYKVWRALEDKSKHVIVQVAPSVRISLGEEFNMPIGTIVTGKMITALRKLGFDKVFDTNTGADFTIMEEGTELIKRLEKNERLPLITSCSPGWVKFCEMHYPEFVENLSTAKSPHQMFGAIIKSYYAEKHDIDPKSIRVISVMPCVAKKYECSRPELGAANGLADVDVVITTRELAKMIKQGRIDFPELEESQFDEPFGESTGAAIIFGSTGGVMEAALRTVSEIVTGKPLKNVEFESVRYSGGVKEAEIQIGDRTLKVAIVNSTGSAKRLLDGIKENKLKYDFIEVMACPGGCITGGGQPIHDSKTRTKINIRQKRAEAVYKIDKNMKVRKAHENEVVKKIYSEYFGEPYSKKAHDLLHTHFYKKEFYPRIQNATK